jgi:ABC-type lipoprotein release transport system permease subunit
VSYSVAHRTQEIGIRMALGAQRSEVMRLVLRQSSVLTIFGIGLGAADAAAVTQYLKGMLFGLTPLDPSTFVADSETNLVRGRPLHAVDDENLNRPSCGFEFEPELFL